MKFTRFTKGLTGGIVALFAMFFAVISVQAVAPGSVPYQDGNNSAVYSFPAFNIYYGVPSVGNEADFVRVKKDGEPNSQYRNVADLTCNDGDRFDVWFYLHNGASENYNDNGNGQGVAKNVRAGVTLPNGEASEFTITGNVTASNAQSISDSTTIKCGDQKFKLSYVADSADAFLDLPNKIVPLPDAFINGMTPIGTNALNGNVWGCFDQRIWMGLKVQVERVEEPPVEEPAPEYSCDVVKLVAGDNRTVKVNDFKYTAKNGAVYKNSTIDWGDSSKETHVNIKGRTHTYAKDGTYTVTVTTNFEVDGKVVSSTCVNKVTYTTDEPPVVTPPKPTPKELPNTGPGGAVALFSSVSLASGFVHRFFTKRRG